MVFRGGGNRTPRTVQKNAGSGQQAGLEQILVKDAVSASCSGNGNDVFSKPMRERGRKPAPGTGQDDCLGLHGVRRRKPAPSDFPGRRSGNYFFLAASALSWRSASTQSPVESPCHPILARRSAIKYARRAMSSPDIATALTDFLPGASLVFFVFGFGSFNATTPDSAEIQAAGNGFAGAFFVACFFSFDSFSDFFLDIVRLFVQPKWPWWQNKSSKKFSAK